MDINTLLDFVEELLSMYGYETRRNVGIKGGDIITAELEKETHRGEAPTKVEAGSLYKVDILAEKKDIERPFGRIIVRYKRGNGVVNVADIDHITRVREAAEAHSGLLLTTGGFTPEAEQSAVPGSISILTPEKVQTLLGKAVTKDVWWHNAPAYPVKWDFEKVKWKLQWFFEKMLFINYSCVWFWNKELAYEPYWKFAYHVRKHGHLKEGFFSINAISGELDVWWDVDPEKDEKLNKKMFFKSEATVTVESTHMVGRTKIRKPKLPKGVHFEVYRPAVEKHEAKLIAQQWVAFVEEVEPEDVVVTGRELVYYPWWKFFYFYRPIVKNAWEDTEYTGFKMSAIYGDIFNQWKLYESFQRDIIYYYMEKSLIKLLGRDRYVKFMRRVTLGVSVLWWNYHLILKPIYVWMLLLIITAGTIYAFITASLGLSIVLGLLLVLIFMGPGYAFLYVLQKTLGKYPVANYPHPKLSPDLYKKGKMAVNEAKSAFKELEELEAADKLTKKEQRELDRIRERRTKGLMKKVKKKNKEI